MRVQVEVPCGVIIARERGDPPEGGDREVGAGGRPGELTAEGRWRKEAAEEGE